MTDKPKPRSKPVDPFPAEPVREPDRTTRQRGLSADTVDEVYRAVLGVDVPPRTTKGQFTKGKSGNPKGRPKRAEPVQAIPPSDLAADSVSAIALRQAARTIKAQTDQGEVELTFAEAAFTKMVREAIKGNTGHSRTFLQLLGRAEAEKAKCKRELFAHWAAVKAQAAQLYLDAELAGEEPPMSVHPDDIELSADGTVTIVGPTTAGDIAVMRYDHSLTDYYIVNMAYHRWIEKRFARSRRQRIAGILYAELDFFDQQDRLPPRLQLPIEEVEERLRRYARFSGRALHGFLRAKAAPNDMYVISREMRLPLVVPTRGLEFAKANKISLRQLLSAWLEVEGKAANDWLDKHWAAAAAQGAGAAQ